MSNYINRKSVLCLTTDKEKKPIPVSLISKDEYDNWQQQLSPRDQSWVTANQFKAATGSVIIFANENGLIEKVTAGAGDESMTVWDYSKIAKSLPDGIYEFSHKMGRDEADKAAFGWAMAHYKFDFYQKKKNNKLATLVVPDTCNIDHVSRLVRGTTITRDLVNTPTNDMGPTELEEVARNLAHEFGARITVTTGQSLLDAGYNTIHAVGRAAEKEPRLIDIIWGNEDAPKVTLVGKGVCFDTGGLDIKPSDAMLIMKKDMGGAAHVLGLGLMIMEAGLDIRLRILIPAVENNIAGNAFRPGDIIQSYKGTTVEIGNTDAEGRLVLCDALALASEERPELIMDFATLTGAARVAMGTDVVPYFTDDEPLIKELQDSSEKEQDPVWPLPLYKPYKKLLNSPIADINNVASTGFGGAITAALFLKEFVDKNISYVHFDVYAWNASPKPGKPKGGEAMGLRTAYRLLVNRFNN